MNITETTMDIYEHIVLKLITIFTFMMDVLVCVSV